MQIDRGRAGTMQVGVQAGRSAGSLECRQVVVQVDHGRAGIMQVGEEASRNADRPR